MNHQREALRSRAGCLAVVLGTSTLIASPVTAGFVAFDYAVTGPVIHASFNVNVAALTAHRFVGGTEVNWVELVSMTTPETTVLSDDLFGTTDLLFDPAVVDFGSIATGVLSVDISSDFFDVLETGAVGLWALLTDTVNAAFALDAIWLEVETASDGVVTSFFDNGTNDRALNGFGIGIPLGGNLRAPLPGPLPPGGGIEPDGFDETISSKAIHAVPAPGTLIVLGAAALGFGRRQRQTGAASGRCRDRRRVRPTALRAIGACAALSVVLVCVPSAWAQVVHMNVNGARGCPARGPRIPTFDCDGDMQAVPHICICPALFGGDCTGDPAPFCGSVCGALGTNSCRISALMCPPGVGVDDDRIDIMIDTAGNCVELCCVNRRCNVPASDALFILYFSPAAGGRRAIGACTFPWGANSGWKEKNAGVFAEITWYNSEGKFPNGKVHDHAPPGGAPNGVEDRYCYKYDVANDKLKIECQQRPIRPNGFPNGNAPWTTVAETGFVTAPQTAVELEVLLQNEFGIGYATDGESDNDMYESWLNFSGSTSGSGSVEITINDFTVAVPTQAGSLASLVADLVAEFNAQWVNGDPQQQMQGLEAKQSVTDPQFMRIRGAIEEQIFVSIIGEPGLTFDQLCPSTDFDQLHLVGPLPPVNVGEIGTITASLQAQSVGIPNAPIDFTKVSEGGVFEFNVGDVEPDGSRTTLLTDANGQAFLTFSAEAAGLGVIEASVEGTSLTAFSIFNMVDLSPCPWDCALDGGGFPDPDGAVATADLLTLLGQWNAAGVLSCDFDGDMDVSTGDMLKLLGEWGSCP